MQRSIFLGLLLFLNLYAKTSVAGIVLLSSNCSVVAESVCAYCEPILKTGDLQAAPLLPCCLALKVVKISKGIFGRGRMCNCIREAMNSTGPSPTPSPTISPASSPTISPASSTPTISPASSPTISPASSPTISPASSTPTISPASSPTISPASSPTISPASSTPIISPASSPTISPASSPIAESAGALLVGGDDDHDISVQLQHSCGVKLGFSLDANVPCPETWH